ncbi:MAG TPA: START domain-containing protein [Albitalea sp.]|uniref:START domain-containing protein n=1 Tax=Piscinibacter sp. TaxID=1903157 RepID=UPI002ED3378D
MPRAHPFVATLALLLVPAFAQTDAPWLLRDVHEPTGTEVFTRDRANGVPEFRAVTRMQARLSALAAALLDVDAMPNWVYRTRSVANLEAVSPTEGYSQVIVTMPWPFDDREAIVHWQLTQDPATGAVTLSGRSAPERLPPDPALVRMPSFESSWTFTPLAGGEVEVVFRGLGDPGGNLASPLLRSFVGSAAWKGPLATIVALRQVVTRPEIASAVLPFIHEPER